MDERLRLSIRTMTWVPLVIAAVVSSAVVAVRSSGSAAGPMQFAAVLLASASGFALDDPAAEIIAASPTSLLRRRASRVCLMLLPAIGVWLVLLAVQGTASPNETTALAAMFSGLLGLAFGAAGVVARREPGVRAGIVVGPALFALVILSTLFPPRFRPLPIGDVPGGWTPIFLRWVAAALLGAIVFLASSRDPAP
jgi:hypothetical protein